MTNKGLLPRPQRPNRAMDAVRRTTEQDRIEQLRKDAGAPTKQPDSVTVAQEAKGNMDGEMGSKGDGEPESLPTSHPSNLPTALDAAALQRLIDQAAQAQVLQAQLASVTEQQQQDAAAHQEQLSQLQAQVTAANTAVADAIAAQEKSDQQIQQLFQISGGDTRGTGQPNAMINTTISTRSDKAPGAAGEYLDLYERAPKYLVLDKNQRQVLNVDQREMTAWLLTQKRADGMQQLLRDMDAWGKANGLFGGGSQRVDAATVRGDIPSGFLTMLSSVIRQTHRFSRILWQFANVRVEAGRRLGDTMQIPRFALQPEPATRAARLLSGGGTFVPIGTTNQNLVQTSVDVVLKENGNPVPISVPQFLSSYSLMDLMPVVQGNLWHDYCVTEDVAMYEILDLTSRIVYNDRGNVTPTVGDVGNGDDGTFTQTFAANLYAYMRSLAIPTWANGCYVAAVNTFAATSLKLSLEKTAAPPTPQEVADITNMLNMALAGEMDRVSGYLGTFENMMIFETNSYGCGATATRGVRNETLGGTVGSVPTRTSWAFGANIIGKAEAMPFEVRQNEVTNFGRLDEFTWLSHEEWAPLDLDPTGTGNASQQLRAIEIRTTAQPVAA